MKIEFRQAIATDMQRCSEIRGLTQDNAFNKQELAAIGVTESAWAPLIDNGTFTGTVALVGDTVIGFCFGDTQSGEILALAIIAGYEGKGIGKALLSRVSEALFSAGQSTLWLAASAKPVVRAYGFYRNLGWQPTNTFDSSGDEILRFSDK